MNIELLKPENSDFLTPNNGSMTIKQRLSELFKSKHYPIVIQFDNEYDIQEFAEAALTIKK